MSNRAQFLFGSVRFSSLLLAIKKVEVTSTWLPMHASFDVVSVNIRMLLISLALILSASIRY